MTPDGAFDRRLTAWLEEDAAPRAPQGFDEAVTESVDQKRQLPSWATPERWISMETQARLGVVPRAVIFIFTIAFLAAALAVSLAVAGAYTNADDGGGPLAGLTYHTREGGIFQHPAGESEEPVRLTDEDETASTASWSRDGERFAYLAWTELDRPTTVMIRDADGSNPIVVSEPFGPGPPPVVVWSPDGSSVLYSTRVPDTDDEGAGCQLDGAFCGARVWGAPADGSEMAQVIGDPGLDACDPAWTPDGEGIIFSGSAAGSGIDRGIYRMDADGANVERIGDLAETGCSYVPHAISPDGTTLAVTIGEEASDVYLVDLATGEAVLITGEEHDELLPVWSPDGSMLAFWSILEDGFDLVEEAMLYDVASGETAPLGASGEVTGWSPNGRSLVTRNLDGILTLVDLTDPTAPVATVLEDVPDGDRPSWRPRP